MRELPPLAQQLKNQTMSNSLKRQLQAERAAKTWLSRVAKCRIRCPSI